MIEYLLYNENQKLLKDAVDEGAQTEQGKNEF